MGQDAAELLEEELEAATCGCFGFRKPKAAAAAAAAPVDGTTDNKQRRRSTVYYSAQQDTIQLRETDFHYLESVEEEEDEGDDPYPIITTTVVSKAPKRASILVPETLLREESDRPQKPAPKRASVFRKTKLVQPRVKIVERGYPGQLDSKELQQTLYFREQMQDRPIHKEIVLSYAQMEDEAYALCRFMRGCKFVANEMLDRLEQLTPDWLEAKKHSFFPVLEEALGVPTPLFLRMYPTMVHGNAKNGCPVVYLKAGTIDVEGLLCLSTVEQSERFFWNQNVYQFPKAVRRAQELNPDFCRCESVQVFDLQGLSRKQFNADSIAVLKLGAKVANYFPETLHCMLILNAPGWFSMAWTVIKKFIDPRTARKIEVFSSVAKGRQRLHELVDHGAVPSDFGGKSPSLAELMQGDGGERHIVKLVDLNTCKKGRTVIDLLAGSDCLKEGETLSIDVFSRSVVGCRVSILGSDKHTEEVKVKPS